MKKIIEYGLYLLVFLLPLQTRYILKYGMLNNGPWEYGTFSIYAIDILLILLVLLTITMRIKNKTFFKNFKNKYWIIILGLFLVSIFSISSAVDISLAIYNIIKLLLGILLFYLITNNTFDKTKMFFSFLIGSFIQACLAIWQFLTQLSFSNKYLGIAYHDASNLGDSVVHTINPNNNMGERWLRAYGGLDHPNILGGLLAIALLTTIYLILKRAKKNKTLLTEKDKSHHEFFYYIFLIALSAGLFFSFSRTSWISFCVGLLILIFSHLKHFKKIIGILIPIAIIFGLFGYQYSYLITSRVNLNNGLENKSTSERIEYIQNTKEILKNNWVTGVGLGNYGLAIHKEIDNEKTNWYYQPVHNVPLLIFSEIGIIGLVLFIILLLTLLISDIKNIITNSHDELTWLNIKLLISVSIIMMFDHWLWSLHFGILLFWLIIGIIVNNLQNKETGKNI